MMRLVPRSLLGQLVLLILFALVAAQVVSFWLLTDERSNAVRRALVFEAADRVASVARLLDGAEGDTRTTILDAATSPSARFSLDKEASIPASEGSSEEIVARLGALLPEEQRKDLRARLEPVPLPWRERGWRWRNSERHGKDRFGERHRGDERRGPPPWARNRMAAPGVPPMHLRVAVLLSGGEWLNMEMRLRRPDFQRPSMFFTTLLLTVGGLIIALWFGLRRITGPLQRLSVAADHLGRGEEIPPLPTTGPREVQALSKAFSDMQERLTRMLSDRTRMLAALGHDLRSPITALRLRAEMVDDEETHTRMVTILDEMQEMVESTLAYARGISEDEATETVDLTALVTELAAEVSETGPEIAAEPPLPALSTRLRRTSIRRALRNVLENAQRYGGGASVHVLNEGAQARIVVADNGPGIAPDALERVFDPFVRLEESRSRDTGGTGLGLSIARTILRAHGGDITLANRAEGGLEAVITLPLAGDDA
ncbi:MAG: two-component sensor histidine kinase [Hyphomicrobiales bacterium]|nr:MAG: two-component sensor histidine kinase [Hyphomicrobiales bacterium]